MNIEVLNLSGYEMPQAIEDKRKGWVAYGEDNNYYWHLTQSYLQSATNNAAIRSIADQTYGEGICIDGLDKDDAQVVELRKMIPFRDLKKIILDKKMLGDAAAQIIYEKKGKNNRRVKQIKHFPISTLRPEIADEEGNINGYYYHHDWANKRADEQPKYIPGFGTSGEQIEIYIFRSYTPGYHYFSPIDYSGALPYAELENEISDYLLNEVKNSFSGTKIVNFNNGVPDQEQRRMISNDVLKKLSGSRGQKVIVSFGDNKESATTVDDISLNDAPSHYEYLADEARNKILVGHRITSPMLLGIKDTGNGLGNNADEIKTASQLFNSTVIGIYQDDIAEQLENILELNGERLQLYFMTAQPIEFDVEDEEADNYNDGENKVDSKNDVDVDDDAGAKEKTNLSANFKNEDQVDWLMHLAKKGEPMIDDNDWVMVDSRVDDDETEDEDWELGLTQMLSAQPTIALSTPVARRAENSVQDTKWLKVRYAYVERHKTPRKSSKSRKFCTAMENAKKLYRKEDIIQMQSEGWNRELGHNKQPYSIWRHKGGVNCTHVWERRIYVKRSKLDGTPWGGNAFNGVKKISVGQAKKYFGFDKNRNKFKNDRRVAEAQIDRSDKGHHPNYFKNR